MRVKIAVATVISLALDASAFWRLPCRDRVALERIDPIVNPGGIAAHAHTIHGPNTFSANATYEDLMRGTCTSCQVKQDKSAYWTPPLYFQHADGSFELVPQTGGMLVYYLQRGDDVRAPPVGLKMLAGDPNLRDFTYRTREKSHWEDQDRTEDALRQKAVGFNCLNYAEPANAALGLRRMPEDISKCKDGLRAEVFFPSCWDGERLDAPDHKDHMRYPSLMDDGECPESHPVRIVSLFFETIWNVDVFTGKPGQFVFSNGDPLGYGYHGDFMHGWDQRVLEQAVAECRSPTGIVEECGSCKVKQFDIMEDLVGPLLKLPGCNPVTHGPEPASPGKCDLPVIDEPEESTQTSSTSSSTSETPVVQTSSTSSSTSETPVVDIDLPKASIPVTEVPKAVTASSVGVAPEPEITPLTTSQVENPHLVVVTITSYTTVNVYVDPEPTPSLDLTRARRRHNHMKRHGHQYA
ncbi:hypothetical protein BDZ91DRAFT_766127 [Kalaharituber pfeilii]|nr:hypothetical protein BDZ91DRAFT_766127 [Kalaharituber pfeilii]